MVAAPNFVVFMTDQQRADWLGCAGHPVVRTPNIDSIAAAGTRFERFSVASPVCSPNRASFMTGRYPSTHGLRYNGLALPDPANTFVDVLARAGYDTAAIGKSHLQPNVPQPARHLAEELSAPRPIEEAWRPGAADLTRELPQRYGDTPDDDPSGPYYGFDHVEMVIGHGDRGGGHYERWFRQQRSDWQQLWDRDSELPHGYTCPQAYRTPVPEELYPTTWVASRAVDYLADPGRRDSPFFLFVSFPDPHHPFNPPGRYWDMYDPEEFKVRLPYDAHHNPPPPLAWLQRAFLADEAPSTRQTAFRARDRHLQEAMALTAGMMSLIDDQIGRVLAALADHGHHDRTVICYTSDHGDYLGDFGLLLKEALPFRSITEVPMLWSDPVDRSPAVTDALASTIDIGPTILDRAGLSPFRGTQGRSFLPTIRTGVHHRSEVTIEYNQHMAKLGFERPARLRSLRTDRWRLTIYAGHDWGELYDLSTDPDETRNLWDSEAHRGIRGDLALRLSHQLTDQMDESPRSEYLA